MGRPYTDDISLLAASYRRGHRATVDALAEALRLASDLTLVAVGSGGALTLGELASRYHEHAFGQPAFVSTPLNLAQTGRSISRCAVLITSARGANPDILAAFRAALALDAKRVIVACGRVGSPLARIARRHRHVDVIELEGFSRPDGFLATGSLFSLGAMLARGFALASGTQDSLPKSLDGLLSQFGGLRGLSGMLSACSAALHGRKYFLTLFCNTTRAAAVDLESKFSETGLGAVQAVDFRNFAHGRHFWLARHAADTAVIALESERVGPLADSTIGLIGTRVPTLRVRFNENPYCSPLAAVAVPVVLTGLLARLDGFDPGRPGIPQFGRRLYHLRPQPRQVAGGKRSDTAGIAAIERKSGLSICNLQGSATYAFWQAAYREFVERLQKVTFRAIAFDYDGTLCERVDRFLPLSPPVRAILIKLLRSGIPIGIATGRGQSVGKALRDAIPRQHWPTVHVGYYNGGQRGTLNSSIVPTRNAPIGALERALNVLQGDSYLPCLATFEGRSSQVTVTPKAGVPTSTLWHATGHVLQTNGLGALTVVRSSHSVDVLAESVSKRLLREEMERSHGPVLAIGDSGAWPGNDVDFLAGSHGLSVDEVSKDPHTCWNLGPPGYRGVECCMYYCAAVRARRSGFTIRLPEPKE